MELNAPAVVLGGQTVLRAASLTVDDGKMLAVVGPNGAGKSTLLRVFAGVLPGGGKIDPRLVAYVPQGARSAWGMLVEEVVMLGRIPHGDRDAARVAHAMEVCGVAGLKGARVDRISGGQARRVMLARALATAPALLLLDEPTADLDPAAGHEVMAVLRRTGATVVVVLHALDLAVRYADRMVVMAAGRIVADGVPSEVLPAAGVAFGMRVGLDGSARLLPPEP